MTYGALALVLLAVAAVAAIVGARSLSPARRRAHLLAVLAAAVGLVVLTAVFDNVMIRLELFHYASERTSGVNVGRAPIEDFAYPLACALALPAVWVLLRKRRDTGGENG